MRIGIIGAMDEEIARLLEAMTEAHEHRAHGFTLYRGGLEGHEIVLVKSGIGKVNAAISTQRLLQEGVDAVVFTGVAGALDPDLGVGDLVVSTDLVQHDVDVTALGYALGEVPDEGITWKADARLLELALEAARETPDLRVSAGRIASGDQFVANAAKVRSLRKAFAAVCTEMEGAATAQVCTRYGVPFVVIRSISDSADAAAEIDFRAFALLAAERAEGVVRGVLRRL